MSKISLREAVARYKRAPGSPSNAFDWYRRQAQRDGRVSFDDVVVPASKSGGAWVVEEDGIERAVASLGKKQARVRQATAAFEKGEFAGKPGEEVRIEGGSYRVSGDFHFLSSDYLRARKDSDGTWLCNRCRKPASLEHKREECHRCSDWGGCGRDCTLSRVYCETCNVSMGV